MAEKNLFVPNLNFPAKIVAPSGGGWSRGLRYRFSARSAYPRPDGSEKSFCAKFEFSRQKCGYHRVGDGPEGSGTNFRPDRVTGGRMASENPVLPNLNFPAKTFLASDWPICSTKSCRFTSTFCPQNLFQTHPPYNHMWEDGLPLKACISGTA